MTCHTCGGLQIGTREYSDRGPVTIFKCANCGRTPDDPPGSLQEDRKILRLRERLRHLLYGAPERELIGIPECSDETPPTYGAGKKRKSGRKS